MKTNIGIIVLFIFMILSSIAAAWDFFENDKHSYLDIITFLAGLSVFTFFLVTYKQFLTIIIISNLLIVISAILHCILNKSFHLMHHVVRIVLLFLVYILLLS